MHCGSWSSLSSLDLRTVSSLGLSRALPIQFPIPKFPQFLISISNLPRQIGGLGHQRIKKWTSSNPIHSISFAQWEISLPLNRRSPAAQSPPLLRHFSINLLLMVLRLLSSPPSVIYASLVTLALGITYRHFYSLLYRFVVCSVPRLLLILFTFDLTVDDFYILLIELSVALRLSYLILFLCVCFVLVTYKNSLSLIAFLFFFW